MASENRIAVGCRVVGKVGPFIFDERTSSVSTTVEPSAKRVRAARRSRHVFHGTVVSSVPDKHWRVHWDELGKTSDHTHGNLRVLSTATVADADPELLRSWKEDLSIYVENHQAMLSYTNSNVTTINNADNVSANNITIDREQSASSPPPPLQPPSDNLDTSNETAHNTELTEQNLPPLEDNDDTDNDADDGKNLIDDKEL